MGSIIYSGVPIPKEIYISVSKHNVQNDLQWYKNEVQRLETEKEQWQVILHDKDLILERYEDLIDELRLEIEELKYAR